MLTEKNICDAQRLASTLSRYAEDDIAVSKIANALHYHAPQLKEDMRVLNLYLRELEKERNEHK